MGKFALGSTRHAHPPEGLPSSPLGAVLQGALAGFAGTLVLSLALKGAQWLVGRGGGDASQQSGEGAEQGGIGAGEALTGGQVQAPFLDRSTEIFAQKVATGLFGASLPAGTRQVVGVVTHFLYGGFWGAVYGVLQSSLRLPAALHGPLYGLIVWLIGPVTLVPAMGIMPPLQRQETRRALMLAGFHVAYGLALGLTFEACAGPERRR